MPIARGRRRWFRKSQRPPGHNTKETAAAACASAVYNITEPHREGITFGTIQLMYRVLLLIAFPFLVSGVFAQAPADVLATSKVRTFTANDLTPEARTAYLSKDQAIAAVRKQLLSEMAAKLLVETEAKALGSTPEKLIAAQHAKLPDPEPSQIEAVYNANRQALDNKPLAEVRNEIVAYLRREPEQKAVNAYIDGLRQKYRFAVVKDINAPNLSASDVLFTFSGGQIRALEFETAYKRDLNDELHDQYEYIRSDLEINVLNALVEEEARSKGTDAGSIIASEVTDRMREFSEGEREGLETELMEKLFAKYNVKFLIREPEIIVENVSVDDDPAFGPQGAPVTVVMFSDFQCPACSRTHPVLKRVLAEFDGKVRFVVRDYPLEKLHPNALAAALAANAAQKQGKYREYIERLYANQDSLDRASLVRFAQELGLNVRQFEIDSSDVKALAEIRKDQADGNSYGVSGTPTIFVNGVKIHNLSSGSFRRAIQRALK